MTISEYLRYNFHSSICMLILFLSRVLVDINTIAFVFGKIRDMSQSSDFAFFLSREWNKNTLWFSGWRNESNNSAGNEVGIMEAEFNENRS